MRSWVKHNYLEDMSDLLIYDLNDFTLSGNLCHYKETAEAKETKIMPNTPMKELYNLYKTYNISVLNPNSIMLILSLTTLLMRIIGYCKQEENS